MPSSSGLRLARIDLRLLRYFVAVAEEGHLTRAAKRLNLQQPPLSQQIRQLETELGVVLFDRLPRGMALTQSGEALLTDARAILAQVDQAVLRVRRVASGQQGSLTVGFTSSAAFHPIVPASLREFRLASPQVTLALQESSTAELIDALSERRLDAAFVRLPVGPAPQVRLDPLYDEAMIAALPSMHPLARRKSRRRIELDELAAESFILYRRPSAPGMYDAIIAACRTAGFSPRIDQEAPRMLSTLSLVAAGLGVTLVPESISRVAVDGVDYRRLSRSTDFRVPLSLAYRVGQIGAATERLIAQVRATVATRREGR